MFYIYSTSLFGWLSSVASGCHPAQHSCGLYYTSILGYMLGFARVFRNLKFYSGNHSLLKIHLRFSTSFCTTEGNHECPHETSHIMLVLREYCFWYGPRGNLEILCKYIMASFEACCFVLVFSNPFLNSFDKQKPSCPTFLLVFI